ncbi:MAG: transcriptional regulator NrdR [Bdellovibrionaceae bacterium]|nr:transcriptional regulator NrdR [Pseudobdellovibrionaceae bacterium]MDW8190048.1 transcriptional regulator NrdR [Pseudobdellovibrionaceae bacterium]
MKCPFCGHLEDRVIETREQKDGLLIRRRRECLGCRQRFTTVENLFLSFPLVIKKDGRREEFSKLKILKGIQAACQKRAISLAQMDHIVESIAKWAMSLPEKEISSQLIGEQVMMALKAIDDVAYVRFASVYKTFKDLNEFVRTLSPSSHQSQENSTKKENPKQLSLGV